MAAMTITTDTGQALELAAAVGAKLSLGRSANAAEVKVFTISLLEIVVKDYRRLKTVSDNQAAIDAPFTPV